VGNRHKLVQGRPAQNGVEGEVHLRDVEEYALCAKALRHPECDREGDTATWHNWYQAHPGEWERGLEFRHQDLQLLESCEPDEVESSTTINYDVVQLDVGHGWGDEQWELPDAYHALGTIRGIKTDRHLHPLMVRHRPGSRSGYYQLSAQGLDNTLGRNILGAPEHNVECFAALVVARLGVRVAIHGLQCPLGVLELHLLVFLLLGVDLLFALPLAGRRAFLVWLLLLFVELFCELIDLSTLTHAVACGVVHRASGATVITAGHLMGPLVASWVTTPTHRRSCGSGSTSQRLVVAADLLLLLLLLLVVVAAALSGGPRIRLAIASYPRGR
jgi:hypothetical protein